MHTATWPQTWEKILGLLFQYQSKPAIGRMSVGLRIGFSKNGAPLLVFSNVEDTQWFDWLGNEINNEIIEMKKWRTKPHEMRRPVNVFVSYSHQDSKDKDRLIKHFAAMSAQSKISIWHDRDIEVGDDLQRAIDLNLSSSNIFLALISPDYMDSQACMNELKAANKMRAKAKIKIASIILKPCDWKTLNLSKHKLLPNDAHPVNDKTKWQTKDHAFLNVVDEVKKIVEKCIK